MSESEAAGRLTKIPGIVDADATTPSKSSGVPKLEAKGFSTGFLDMVELKIANRPMTQRIKKKDFEVHFALNIRLDHKGAYPASIFVCCFRKKECSLLM
jgi:hypothetical protein